ncbi:MAG: NHL repeat-containing protein [Thaumarchaeota archaeon]|nr:NHL repeat-containing protein [Nitrososphaerota archaeon]
MPSGGGIVFSPITPSRGGEAPLVQRLPSRWLIPLAIGLLLMVGGVANVHAFVSSSQNSNVVLGQPDFTSSASAITSTGLHRLHGITFDSSGNLWVADYSNNRVLEYTTPLVTHEAATLVIGQALFTTSAAATTSTGLFRPHGVAFDSSGNLWVADYSNNRVLEYTTPLVTHEAATLVIGQVDFTSSGAATTSTGLNNPAGITFDSSGNLWVSEINNARVLKFAAPLSTHEAATLVIGQALFTTSAAATTSTGLFGPFVVAFDSSGNLWVGDTDNHRVLKFAAPLSTHEAATLVIGQVDFTSSAVATTSTSAGDPEGITFDSSGNLWVGDYLNNRVLGYQALASSTQTLAPAVVGTSVPTQTFATTGLTVSATGVVSGTTASIYTADLSAQPGGTGITGLLTSHGFFDVGVSGISPGTATVCVNDASADASTILKYWTGAVWATAASIAVTPGVKVCGDILVSALTGTPLAMGDPPGSPMIPSFPFPFAIPVVLAITVLIYAVMRRRLLGGETVPVQCWIQPQSSHR